jgi:hypothetical protein
VSSISILRVESTRDIYENDTIYIGELGSGEVAIVENVIGDNYIRLKTSLASVPDSGTSVLRPSVQNVRIDNVELEYDRDYSFDAETSVLTLRDSAEANACPIFQMGANVSLTNASRAVTGTGFQGVIFPGYMIGVVGNAEFFEVCSVESDTALTLRTPATFSLTAIGRYKSLIHNPGVTVLTLDAIGRTDDGTTDGILLKTAPQINKQLLEDAGLGEFLDADSFSAAEELAYQDLGLVIPDTYDGTTLPTYRDTLNRINKSVFGSLVQNVDFMFGYQVLRPNKTLASTKFSESDIISFTLSSTAENVVKTATINYQPREYDYLSLDTSIRTTQSISDNAQYVVRTDREKVIDTLLANQADAEILAARWSFILENASTRISLNTKLQGMRLQVGDIIEIDHRKFFERMGSVSRRKLFMCESVNRNGTDVKIEATDLSNAFTRVATINDYVNDWSSASETERLFGGFITDEYGLIDNNPDSFQTNLIW